MQDSLQGPWEAGKGDFINSPPPEAPLTTEGQGSYLRAVLSE